MFLLLRPSSEAGAAMHTEPRPSLVQEGRG